MNGFYLFPPVGFLLIIALILGRIIALKKKGVKTSSDTNQKKSPILYPSFLLILLLWIFEMIKAAFQISFSVLPSFISNFLIESTCLIITGSVIISLGLISLGFTLHSFGKSLRFGLDKNNQGRLITNGIFSISRNPFFVSINLYFLGIAVIFPNLFFIGFFILSIVGTHFFILKEEKFMHENYGHEYQKYTQKVKRYF